MIRLQLASLLKELIGRVHRLTSRKDRSIMLVVRSFKGMLPAHVPDEPMGELGTVTLPTAVNW